MVQVAESSDDTDDEPQDGTRRCADFGTDFIGYVGRNSILKFVDAWCGSLLMSALVVRAVYLVGQWVVHLSLDVISSQPIRAMDVTRFSEDIAQAAILMLSVMLWHTICFNEKSILEFWTSQRKHISSIMSGGFIPRPAAFSMSILLFVTQNLVVTELTMGGKKLLDHAWDGSPLGDWDSCMADALEIDTYGGDGPVSRRWLQRFSRQLPHGCYGVEVFAGGYLHYAGTFSDFGNLTAEQKKNASRIPGLVHPMVDGTADTSMWCTYQCAVFKAVSFQGFVTSLGSIFAGAAIIVTIADFFSERIGWLLVEQKTSPHRVAFVLTGQMLQKGDDMDDAARLQPLHTHHPGSTTLCAVQMFMLLVFSYAVAPRLTVDGYFTVDFWTTITMMFASLASLLLRFWSPFTCRTIVYTKTLWNEGKDQFFVYDEAESRFKQEEISLYEWIHIPHAERNKLLLHYCSTLAQETIAKHYDTVGLIADQHRQDSCEEQAETVTVFMCHAFDLMVSYAYHAFHPQTWCATQKEETMKGQIFVVTRSQIKLVIDELEWRDVKGVPEFTHRHRKVLIDADVRGVVTKACGEEGQVHVEFGNEEREGYVMPPVCYLDARDHSKRVPVQLQQGTFGEYKVPFSNLEIVSSHWDFARKLIGEEKIQNLIFTARRRESKDILV